MFALPSAVSLTGLQAGTILRTCYKRGATKSQLESVRKTLAYAFQLTTGFDGNYDEVEIAANSFDPLEYGKPTRTVMPVRIIPPDRLADAFLKEWAPDCGMSLPEWCVGGGIGHIPMNNSLINKLPLFRNISEISFRYYR